MPDDRSVRPSREKSFAVAALRIGSHPLVYSIVIVLGVGAVVFFMAITPLVRMLQTGGRASVGDAQSRNIVAKDALDAEKKLSDAASSISSDDQALLAYALPAAPDEPGLAVILKSLAARSGIKLSSLDVSPVTSDSSAAPTAVGQVSISMTLDLVSYDRLKITLLNTEDSLRIFDLKSFSFSPTTGTVSIGLTAYYLNNV